MKVRAYLSSTEADAISSGISVHDREIFETSREPLELKLESCVTRVEVKNVDVASDVAALLTKLPEASYFCRRKLDEDENFVTIIDEPVSSKKVSTDAQDDDEPPDMDAMFNDMMKEENKKKQVPTEINGN